MIINSATFVLLTERTAQSGPAHPSGLVRANRRGRSHRIRLLLAGLGGFHRGGRRLSVSSAAVDTGPVRSS